MIARNELRSSPDGAINNIALADADNIACVEECDDQTTLRDGENPGLADAAGAGASDDLVLTTPHVLARTSAARILHATLKPLIAMMTSPYALVTMLAAFTALIVASEAGKAINAKLEPIIAALKRL